MAVVPAEAKSVKVGLLLPYSSVFAALGKEIDEGFALALERHGAEAGATFEIVREDTEVKPPVGLAKAKKMVLEDKVDVMVGIVSSGVLAAIRDFIDQSKMPLIVANAGNDDATGENCSRYIVRVSFSNGQVNRPMGSWLYSQGVRKIYTLAADYAAGHQMIETFSKEFTKVGGEIVGSDWTPFRQTKDFGPYLTKAMNSGADGIFVFYAGGEAIAFVKQYAEFGVKGKMKLYGSGFLTSPLYVNAQGPAAEGVIASLHYVPTIDTPANKEFVEVFKAKYNRVPSEYAVQGYDAGRALVEALKTNPGDSEALARALSAVKFEGPRGPFQIDPATNNIVQNIYIFETVAGEGGLTQKVVGVVENVRDEPMGCKLQ
ncbi:MAG: ABC transporter substrate-binding protein [Rhizobiales bacterium]|nr:ABC transporter substrate-binding protein [Hyphomicrobiales bacterium]